MYFNAIWSYYMTLCMTATVVYAAPVSDSNNVLSSRTSHAQVGHPVSASPLPQITATILEPLYKTRFENDLKYQKATPETKIVWPTGMEVVHATMEWVMGCVYTRHVQAAGAKPVGFSSHTTHSTLSGRSVGHLHVELTNKGEGLPHIVFEFTGGPFGTKACDPYCFAQFDNVNWAPEGIVVSWSGEVIGYCGEDYGALLILLFSGVEEMRWYNMAMEIFAKWKQEKEKSVKA
ncbi:hypothetical protein EV368DRAFT_69003 [Lentinula lateritia]|nr:hypothetical protein EV368DRAFT_69003 [Lentinula lateritia]